MNIDRQKAPSSTPIGSINIAHAEKNHLSNNIPVYSINAGTQELSKIELIFSAGTYQQERPVVASATNAMLNEGTKVLKLYEETGRLKQDAELISKFPLLTLF